jgi:hypothetical protein
VKTITAVSRLAAATIGATALALSLTGCFQLPPSAPDAKPAIETPVEATTPTPSATAPAGSTASGDITPPGTTLAIGEWAHLPFTNLDDGEAVIDATVTKVEPAPQADVDLIASKVPELKGFNVYYVWVDMKKNSGASVEYEAMYTDFETIDAAGNKTQSVSLIGYDNCPNASFPSGFDTSGETITTCLAGVAPAGGNAPVGAQYRASNTPYSSFDGQPVLWK